MRLAVIILLGLALGFEKPIVSEETLLKIKSVLPGITEDCLDKIRWGGIDAMPNGTDKCFVMTDPKRWRGIAHFEFEQSRFCADAVDRCPQEGTAPMIWLRFSPSAEANVKIPLRPGYPDFGTFRIEFIGRRTISPGGFGHMGAYEHEMIVDRIISVEPMAKDVARES